MASFSNITRVQTYKEKFKWGLEWNKKNSLFAFISLKFWWNAIIDSGFPKPNYVNTPIWKSRLIKKSWLASTIGCKNYLAIKISPSSWHREIATESWACFTKKSFMEIVVLLQELFWNFSRSKKSKIDLLRKTQSNHFWYEVQRSRDADFFPFWPTPQNNVEIGKVYFGTWTLVCHKFMTPTHSEEESRAQKDGHGPQLKEV